MEAELFIHTPVVCCSFLSPVVGESYGSLVRTLALFSSISISCAMKKRKWKINIEE